VNLFLDSSVLLAASESASGASRALFLLARNNEWVLLTSSYVLAEIFRCFLWRPPVIGADFVRYSESSLKSSVRIGQSCSRLAKTGRFSSPRLLGLMFLLTLDRGDFETLIGKRFYGLAVVAPAAYLAGQRASGRLIVRAD
jgi:hypothetical protein